MQRRTFLTMPAAALLGQEVLPGFYRKVHRVTWVTPDTAATAAAWAKLGVRVLTTYPAADLAGEKVQVTVATLGALIIDWIQPVGGRGLFADYLERHRGPGIMGLMHNVPTPEALRAEVARLGAAGVKPKLAGVFSAGEATAECAFMDTAERGMHTLGLVVAPDSGMDPGPPERQVTQFAFIASKPEPVSAFWASLGWPAFTYTEVVSRDPVYRGKPGVFGMRLGWQRHGPVPFEWIQPLQGPSAYHDYLGKFGEGFHHLAFNVADMDRAIEEWNGLGYEMTMAGAWGEKDKPGSGRFAYFDVSRDGGVEVELLWNWRG
jgi:catechol 2,3-dioxygenase-like lactoylglutathione lyase family enzyme